MTTTFDQVTRYQPIYVLDPGHGDETAGKRSPRIPPGVLEHEFNLDVAKRLQKLIIDEGFGCVLTRGDEHTLKIRKRKEIAKDLIDKGELVRFISIHANAAGPGGWYERARGVRVFTQRKSVIYTGSNFLAKLLLENIAIASGLKKLNIKDHITRKGKEHPVGVLNKLKCQAVLTENGFMTSKKDCKILASEEGRQAIALGHFNGILEFERSINKC